MSNSIEFALLDLLNARDALAKISQQSIPAVAAFRFNKIISLVNQELTKFDEARSKLFEQYGENVNDRIQPKEEFKEVFAKELNDLLEDTVSLDIKLVELKHLDNAVLTPIEMMSIARFIAD